MGERQVGLENFAEFKFIPLFFHSQLDKNSWGYRREGVLSDYLTDHEVVKSIAETVR